MPSFNSPRRTLENASAATNQDACVAGGCMRSADRPIRSIMGAIGVFNCLFGSQRLEVDERASGFRLMQEPG